MADIHACVAVVYLWLGCRYALLPLPPVSLSFLEASTGHHNVAATTGAGVFEALVDWGVG